MTIEVDAGSFVVSSATTAGNTAATVSGLSFQPKAVYLMWSGRASDGQGEADSKFGHGFFTSTSARRAQASQSDHSPTTMSTDGVLRDDCCIATLSTAGAVDGRVDVSAINSDGFTLVVDDQLPASLIVKWIAWGGDDITDVAIADFVEPTTNSQQTYNVGIDLDTGEDDKMVLVIGGNFAAINTAHAAGVFNLGLGTGDTIVQGVVSGAAADGIGTSDTAAYCLAGDIAVGWISNSSVTRGTLSGWHTTGPQITWAGVPGEGGIFNFSMLVIKGGRWEVGNALTSTGGSNQTEGTTYVPKGLLIGSACRAASTSGTPTAHEDISIGVATGPSNRHAVALMDKDNSGLADVGVAASSAAMYINQSTAATIAQEGAMDLVSLDSTPGFTYVMDDADPSQSFFFYLSCADAPSSGQTVEIGLATETDTAFSIGRAKAKAIGLNTETDAVLAIIRAKAQAIGLTTETDEAFAVARNKSKAIGLTTEVDEALAFVIPKIVAVGTAEETDAALALTALKEKQIGLGTEADTAFALARNKARVIGQSSEADTALAARPVRLVATGLATETDTAFSFGRLKQKAIGIAEEIDSAFGVSSELIIARARIMLRWLGFGLGGR